MKIKNVFNPILLIILCGVGIASSDESKFCCSNVSNEELLIIEETKKAVIVSAEPEMPSTSKATRYINEISKIKSDDPVSMGCVLLKFEFKNGKAKNIKVEKSHPENLFVRVSIRALEKYKFDKTSGAGMMIFDFEVASQGEVQ